MDGKAKICLCGLRFPANIGEVASFLEKTPNLEFVDLKANVRIDNC